MLCRLEDQIRRKAATVPGFPSEEVHVHVYIEVHVHMYMYMCTSNAPTHACSHVMRVCTSTI